MSSQQHYPINASDLPKTWAAALVGEVIPDIRSGFASGEHSDKPPGILHLRPMNIGRDGRLILDVLRYIPDTGGVRLRSGDILFNNTNSRELVGKTTVIPVDEDYAFSNHMTRLRPPPGVSARFAARQLHYLWMSGYFRHLSTQHVNQASISSKTLASTVPFVLPPTGEQERIIDEIDRQFSRLDAAEAGFKSAISKGRQYRLSVLAAASSGNLVPTEAAVAKRESRSFETGAQLLKQILETRRAKERAEQGEFGKEEAKAGSFSGRSKGNEWPELPVGWTWAKVGEVGELRLGRQRSPEHHTGRHMRAYLRVANVFEDRIDTTDILEMNFTPKEFDLFELRWGDILLNEGQSLELVGRAAMYKDELPGACFQNTLIRFRAEAGINPSYALLVFRHYLHSNRFQQIAKWSTNIAHLGLGRLAQMRFPLPPTAEQDRIAKEAERKLSVMGVQEKSVAAMLKRSRALRHAILQKAMTGKLVRQIAAEGNGRDLLKAIASMPAPTRDFGERHTRPARAPTDNTEIAMTKKRPLYDVLVEDGGKMTTADLFRKSGHDFETVDEFFDELRTERLKKKRIKQVSTSDDGSTLEAVH
jgi:type I restriction enzyme S subunit